MTDFCFVVTPGAPIGDRLRIVVDGEIGYRPVPLDKGETITALENNATLWNRRIGVSEARADRMIAAARTNDPYRVTGDPYAGAR